MKKNPVNLCWMIISSFVMNLYVKICEKIYLTMRKKIWVKNVFDNFFSAFLSESLDPALVRVNLQSGLSTNLNPQRAELLQINNYGIGGFYLPHYDFFKSAATMGAMQTNANATATQNTAVLSPNQTTTATGLDETLSPRNGTAHSSVISSNDTESKGNNTTNSTGIDPFANKTDEEKKLQTQSSSFHSDDRLATCMIYMTDVEAGGATVFPRLNLTLYPEKGAAAFWYNLKRDGTADVDTIHSGCPVLAGTKWVANKWFLEGLQVNRPCGLQPDTLSSIEPATMGKNSTPAAKWVFFVYFSFFVCTESVSHLCACLHPVFFTWENK